MDRVERLAYLITREIEDRPAMKKFSPEEYRELLQRIAAWIRERTKR